MLWLDGHTTNVKATDPDRMGSIYDDAALGSIGTRPISNWHPWNNY